MVSVLRKSGLFLSVALGVLAAPAIAAADTAAAAQGAPPPAAPAAGGQTTAVGEVIVTAMKRAESIQEVPAAISAVSAQTIQQRNIVSSEDLQFAAPSMEVGEFRGTEEIAIRGVGLNSGSGDTPGVAVYVDGVYQPHPALASLSEVDLDRIEVLRGPQGTLYGRNANGWAVSFISDAPTQQFGGYLLADAESYNEYRIQGEVNVPLGDNWAARVVLNHDDREDGFIKNVIPGYENLDRGEVDSARVRLRGEITPKVTVDLEYTGEHSDGPFSYFELHNAPSPIGLALNPYFAKALVVTTPWETSANDPSSTNRGYNLYSGTVTWDSPVGVLKSITAFQTLYDRETQDDDATNISAFPSMFRNLTDTFTQEVSLASKFGPFDTVFGVFYMKDHENDDLLYHFPLGINPLPPESYLFYQEPHYDTQSVAGYGDVTWNITNQLRLIGGLRYSVDHLSVSYENQFGTYAFGPLIPFLNACAPAGPIDYVGNQTEDFHSLTPRAGIQYDFSNDQNVYGTYSQGYKAGGLNTSACDNPYKPETITAYELGYKGRFLDRRLLFDASAFYYDYDNLQIAEVIGLEALTQNAAAARIEGLELESDYTPDNHFIFNASLTLLDAKYVSFYNTDGINPYGNFPSVACVSALSTPTDCVQNLSGHYLNNAPKVSTNLGASYRTSEESWGDLMGRVDVTYRSTTYFREFNEPLDAQPPFALVNLSLTWRHPSHKYSVMLFAKNVGNTPYITTMGTSNNFGARYVTWGDPRQVGVEVKGGF